MKRGPKPKPISERFWPKVIRRGPNECWEWIGAKTIHGYGWLLNHDESSHAHRVSYIMAHGPIDGGLVVDHICNNPSCVNPAHLRAITQKDNVLRSTSPPAQNARKTHCPNGHAYTPENTYRVPKTGYRRCRACQEVRDKGRWRRGKLVDQLL